MDTITRPLEQRNVEVIDSTGAVIAGFWQYGILDWRAFHTYLTTFVLTTEEWSVFEFDPTNQQHGALCPPGPQIVQPGRYILLSTAGVPINVGFVATHARPRFRTITNTPCQHHYVTRGRARDGKCLITGLKSDSRLQVAHIFSRAHDAEWVRKGYPSRITDTADLSSMGGSTKIDSIQNLITLRIDLRDAWDNYDFGVDPGNDYRITAFTYGNEDIDGLRLQLDHIDDPSLRPLDELFTDHFMQGIMRHMKGPAQQEWTYDDYDDDGSYDVLNSQILETREGREQSEIMLVDRLFDHLSLNSKPTPIPKSAVTKSHTGTPLT